MNQDQVIGVLRIVIPTILAYAAAKGWITEGQSADITTAIITLAAAIWSAWAHMARNAVANVAAMPEVKAVMMEPTAAGRSLAAAAGSKPTAVVTVADKK